MTKLSDFCDGGSILLTLNLPKDEPATDTGAAASNDSSEPMDIDVGGAGGTTLMSLSAHTFIPKTPKEAMKIILNSNFDQESKECLQTILKMVDNLLSKSDAKFRSIRVTNKTVEKKITDRKGGLDLLFALGFEYDSSNAGFDFDNSNNVPQQSETIVLRPENEDKELLIDARGHLSEILMKELSDGKVPSMPQVKPIAALGAGNETKIAPFDPFRSQSYNIQAAAAGAPNPNSIIPDGSTGKSLTERKLEILQQKQEKLEQSIQSLGDRGIMAFLPGETGTIVTLNSPGDDILDGKGDSSLLAGLAKKKLDERKKREEGGFQTKSMRELEKMQKAKVYSHAQLKINFPDGVRIEAKFLPNETIQSVKDLVLSTFLPEYSISQFDVYISPPRRVLETNKSLKNEGLVPAAKVHVSWKSGPMQGSPGFYIQPRFFQSLSIASVTSAFPDSVGLNDTKNSQTKGKTLSQEGSDGNISKEEELMQRMLGKRKGLGFGLGKKKGSSATNESKGTTGKPTWFKG